VKTFIKKSIVLENPIAKELADLRIIDPDTVELYYPQVRDREDIAVLRCATSGVIFLNRSDHVNAGHYKKKKGTSYWDADSKTFGPLQVKEDDIRRANTLKEIVRTLNLGADFSYLDVGCGLGGVLRGMLEIGKDCSAIELQDDVRENLRKFGYTVHASFDEVPHEKRFDLVTLFHVFEHLKEPAAMLKDLYILMKPGGTLLIEVPHAKDVLLRSFELDAFKKFTFWSEHVILHTQESLRLYLESSGFQDVRISGVQRYPFANHLYWLWKGEPGGQQKLPAFREELLEKAYEERLVSIDQTDTLLVQAQK